MDFTQCCIFSVAEVTLDTLVPQAPYVSKHMFSLKENHTIMADLIYFYNFQKTVSNL